MSKLISEEIVEAITLGDKEGFMSAFQSALAAKVSDALEIKKVEIASTLIAPASSEVVEEEIEQVDEATPPIYPVHHIPTGKRVGTFQAGKGFTPHPNSNLKPGEIPNYHAKGKEPINMGSDRKMKVEEVEQTDEAVRIYDRIRSKIDPQHGEKGTFQGEMERLHMAAAARDRRKITKGYGVKGFNSAMLKRKTGSLDTAFVRAKKTNEDVEQIDELKKDTLSKYIKSAEADTTNKNREATKNRLVGKRSPRHAAAQATADALDRARNKRLNMMDLARAKMAKEEVEEIDEAKKSETRISWRSRTPEEIEKSDKRLIKKGKLKITSAELEARARARRGEKSE